MTDMIITNAKYVEFAGVREGIKCQIDGEELFVPIASGNRHYDEIVRQQSEGSLTIADAD